MLIKHSKNQALMDAFNGCSLIKQTGYQVKECKEMSKYLLKSYY